MGLVLEIVLGVAILMALVAAFLSTKTWPIYQVVLAVFLMIATVGFFYLATRTLATHNAWGKYIAERQKELDGPTGFRQQIKQIVDGGVPDANGKPSKSMRQLKTDLETLVADRGGMLPDVVVEGMKEGNIQIKVATKNHGLAPNTVLFAFDTNGTAEGGRYLGALKVVSVADNSEIVQVTPNPPTTEAQIQTVTASKGPWTLYLSMPIDDAALFASMDEATRAALVPKESQADFAKADRPMTDYEQFFQDNHVQQNLLNSSIASVTSNIDRTTSATKQASDEVTYRTKEKEALDSDLEKFKHEQQVVTAYYQELVTLDKKLREARKNVYARNWQLASEMTNRQLRSARQIDARTGPAPETPLVVPAP